MINTDLKEYDWRRHRGFYEQLTFKLAASRRAGRSFEAAWAHAMHVVLWPHHRVERAELHRLLEDPAVVAEWRAAYDGQPTPVAEALRNVHLDMLDRGDEPVQAHGRSRQRARASA